MSTIPSVADAAHQKFARLYNLTIALGTPLEEVFNLIVSREGYKGLTAIKAAQKRSLVHRAAYVSACHKQFFEKNVSLRFRRSVPKIMRRMEAQSNRRAEIYELWSFYEGIDIEHRSVLGGLPAARFYKSPHWRRIRHLFLAAFGRKCMCCGARGDIQVEVDHVKPRHLYPEIAFRPDNLQILCVDCHRGKGPTIPAAHSNFAGEIV